MNIPYQYNSVCTKCRAMSASFLKPDDYIYLSKITDLKDIANYLSERDSYSKEFKNIDLSKVSRNYLEQVLNKNVYDTYKTIHIFTSGNLKNFIGALMEKFEVDQIIKCINRYYQNPEEVNFQEFQQSLVNTPYYKIIKNIMPEDKIDIVYIETLLYDVYYNNLYSSYGDNDKDIMTKRVIVENLQRILRLKYNFNLEPNQIYPYLIHIKNSGNINKLMEICDMPDDNNNSDKFLITVAKYLKINKTPVDKNELLSTVYIDNFIYRYTRRIFTNPIPSFETSFAFLSLKEYEVKNLIHIIEGVRYQISSDIILKYIVGLEG